MLKKDLMKEGWIKFEEGFDENIDDEEINILVKEAYKNTCKYKGKSKVNKKLLKRYNNLKNRKHKINTIENISLLRNVKVNKEKLDIEPNETLLVIEDEKGINIVLDLENGIEYTFDNKNIGFVEGKSSIKTLFENIYKFYQEQLNLGYIDSVILYKDRELVHKSTTESLSYPYILEIKDVFNNIIYIDIIRNMIYTIQNDYYLEVPNKERYIILYKKGEENIIPKRLINGFEEGFVRIINKINDIAN